MCGKKERKVWFWNEGVRGIYRVAKGIGGKRGDVVSRRGRGEQVRLVGDVVRLHGDEDEL